MSPSSLELATVISILGRPRIEPLPDGEPLPATVPDSRRRPMQPIRRTVGHWLIRVGGVVGGQRETVNPIA